MAQAEPDKSYTRIKTQLPLPDLIEVQLRSFENLKSEGLGSLFHEISPIESYNKGMKLYFPSQTPEAEEWGLTYWFDEPKHTIDECVERDLTYACPMYVSVLLAGTDIPEPIKQDIFLGDFPQMTDKGTFVINGTERVVVSQLIRSPGVYFEAPVDRATGRPMAVSKLIPDRGAWMEFETRKSDYLTVKFNRKRTIPITIFLRALAAVDDGMENQILTEGTDDELLRLFEDVDSNPDYIAACVIQLGDKFKGGLYRVYQKDKTFIDYSPKFGSIIISDCTYPHEVTKVINGRRKSLVFFISKNFGLNRRKR